MGETELSTDRSINLALIAAVAPPSELS